jgi:hypothetical protein
MPRTAGFSVLSIGGEFSGSIVRLGTERFLAEVVEKNK